MNSALYGGGCPRGLFGRLVDALVPFMKAGRAWKEAGRPRACAIYVDFCDAEREYTRLRNEADAWTWTTDQRAEWTRVHRAFDPEPV